MCYLFYATGAAQKWFSPDVRGFVGSLGKPNKNSLNLPAKISF